MGYINYYDALDYRKLLDECASSVTVDDEERCAEVADESAIVSKLIEAVVLMLHDHLTPCEFCGGYEDRGYDCCDECVDIPDCLYMPRSEDARAMLARAVHQITNWGEPLAPAPIIGGIEYDPSDR